MSAPATNRTPPGLTGRSARVLVGLVISLGLLAVAGTGSTDAADGPAALRKEVEGLSRSLQQSRDEFNSANERARSAAIAEAELADRVEAGRTRLASLRRQVAREELEVQAAGRALDRARASLARRLVEIYMAGAPRIGDLLLASGDYGDLASRSAYLEAIGDSDRVLARRVAQLRRTRVESLRAKRKSRAQIGAELVFLADEMASTAAAREEAQSTASRLARLGAVREEQIEGLKDRIATIEARQADAASGGESFLGGPYSIPTYIVMCESGGNYSALNPSSGAGGAYQILPSTWEAYGGEGLPHQAPKSEQDRIAALIWASDGPGAWVCS